MRLLIIGTLGGQIGAASKIAVARGAKVAQADTVENGLRVMRSGQGVDLVMIDVHMDVDDLIAAMTAERLHYPVIACGIETDSAAAVAAIKAGAKEYLPLPPDADLIAAVFEAISEDQDALIFADPAMKKCVAMAEKVAGSQAGILIVGESGTGKELIARLVHRKSGRKDKPFVAINCAAIPGELLESELFGHEKGAFTGAVARRIGKFEEAAGGTLLLDEISEMDLGLQAKLLRAIQEKEIQRVGSNTAVKVNARILATSNRNMEAEVKAGTFREDLYFRLNVVSVAIPPLRDRPADVPVLANHFMEKYAEENDVAIQSINDEALESLQGHNWPGNVRELENTMHRAVLMASSDVIDADAVLLGGVSADDDQSTGSLVGRTVADVERDLIIDTLKHTIGNRTHAAKILGISIRTLRNKLNTYVEQGVPVPSPGEA
ncbi:MAG: AAA domain-containing protein [Alphaproteobacteria bacterium]|nr:AAA domain-containing protein [Alphaproteobacteria bacterium]